MSFGGRANPEWLIVLVIAVLLWMGPGRAIIRGEGVAVLCIIGGMALLLGLIALVNRLRKRRITAVVPAKPGKDIENDHPAMSAFFVIFAFSAPFIFSLVAVFAALSSLSKASADGWRGLGIGLAGYSLLLLLLRAVLFRTKERGGETWKTVGIVTLAAIVLVGIGGLCAGDWIGEQWLTAISGPFVLLILGAIVFGTHRFCMLVFDETNVRRWVRLVLALSSGLCGAAIGCCLILQALADESNRHADSLPWSLMAIGPLVLFVILVCAVAINLRKHVLR